MHLLRFTQVVVAVVQEIFQEHKVQSQDLVVKAEVVLVVEVQVILDLVQMLLDPMVQLTLAVVAVVV
tara:strand:- start:104 stop:304 length:201 start_codon:yes stop_codon:yes gene_type:complete